MSLEALVYLFATAILVCVLFAIARSDIRSFRIPNELVILLSVAAVPAILFFNADLLSHLWGAAICFLLGVAIAFGAEAAFGRPALGMGDVKLFSAATLWLGIVNMPAVLVVASSTALTKNLVTGADRGKPIAFGPYLCFAILVVWIWNWWAA